jgi:hypothetical protein
MPSMSLPELHRKQKDGMEKLRKLDQELNTALPEAKTAILRDIEKVTEEIHALDVIIREKKMRGEA